MSQYKCYPRVPSRGYQFGANNKAHHLYGYHQSNDQFSRTKQHRSAPYLRIPNDTEAPFLHDFKTTQKKGKEKLQSVCWESSIGSSSTQPPLPPTPAPVIPPPPSSPKENSDENNGGKVNPAPMESSTKPKRKHKRTPRTNASKDWSIEKAQMAYEAEQELTKDSCKNPVLYLRFPDPPLCRDIVQNYCPDIENVHFPQNSAPRFCFVYLKEHAQVNEAIEQISKIPFGTGFVKAELKQGTPTNSTNCTNVDNIDPYTLYVGNLQPNIACKVLKEYFHGSVRIDIGFAQRMKNTRYAFIRYSKVEDAIAAYRRMINTEIDGRSLILRFRRLGDKSNGDGKNESPSASLHEEGEKELGNKKESSIVLSEVMETPTSDKCVEENCNTIENESIDKRMGEHPVPLEVMETPKATTSVKCVETNLNSLYSIENESIDQSLGTNPEPLEIIATRNKSTNYKQLEENLVSNLDSTENESFKPINMEVHQPSCNTMDDASHTNHSQESEIIFENDCCQNITEKRGQSQAIGESMQTESNEIPINDQCENSSKEIEDSVSNEMVTQNEEEIVLEPRSTLAIDEINDIQSNTQEMENISKKSKPKNNNECEIVSAADIRMSRDSNATSESIKSELNYEEIENISSTFSEQQNDHVKAEKSKMDDDYEFFSRVKNRNTNDGVSKNSIPNTPSVDVSGEICSEMYQRCIDLSDKTNDEPEVASYSKSLSQNKSLAISVKEECDHELPVSPVNEMKQESNDNDVLIIDTDDTNILEANIEEEDVGNNRKEKLSKTAKANKTVKKPVWRQSNSEKGKFKNCEKEANKSSKTSLESGTLQSENSSRVSDNDEDIVPKNAFQAQRNEKLLTNIRIIHPLEIKEESLEWGEEIANLDTNNIGETAGNCNRYPNGNGTSDSKREKQKIVITDPLLPDGDKKQSDSRQTGNNLLMDGKEDCSITDNSHSDNEDNDVLIIESNETSNKKAYVNEKYNRTTTKSNHQHSQTLRPTHPEVKEQFFEKKQVSQDSIFEKRNKTKPREYSPISFPPEAKDQNEKTRIRRRISPIRAPGGDNEVYISQKVKGKTSRNITLEKGNHNLKPYSSRESHNLSHCHESGEEWCDDDIVPENNALNSRQKSIAFLDLTLEDESPQLIVKQELETEDLFLMPKTTKSQKNETRITDKNLGTSNNTDYCHLPENSSLPEGHKTHISKRSLEADDKDDDVIFITEEIAPKQLDQQAKKVENRLSLQLAHRKRPSGTQKTPVFNNNQKVSRYGDKLDRLFDLLDSDSDAEDL
ncbi:RNA binding domain-containing protein painting of fourth [Haematobia irritans]|uniref:RNA binding domain-containing protein painting of fourth n=1 Tax=Haematobia irritans TaxID=7368 RepID=UPI003F4FB5A6